MAGQTLNSNEENGMSLFTLQDRQLIVYGAPGTGKSFGIENTLQSLGFSMSTDVKRVVFHKDYTYSDFIGCLMPESSAAGLDYVFEPGPFTLALEKALENPNVHICLLIEEMNRGNCGGIFGDIFQLLDRDASGDSVYPVSNADIRYYLRKNPLAEKNLARWSLGHDDIYIPGNLYIIGTMNTADQNVFVMDSAFKRRFKMRYVPVVFNTAEPHLAKLDSVSQTTLFTGGRKWSDFAQEVNQLIDTVNSDMLSISEDKKLGPYFVDEVDVSCKQAFCDKVIYYLKNDVFKFVDAYFYESYEEMYDKIMNHASDIFDCLKGK